MKPSCASLTSAGAQFVSCNFKFVTCCGPTSSTLQITNYQFLDAQRFACLLAVEQCIKNHTRYKHRSEQVRQETKGQRHRKALHRPRAEHKEDDGRDDGGHVRVNNRDPGVSKPLIHGCC